MSDWVLFEFGREGKIVVSDRRADLGTLLILNASLHQACVADHYRHCTRAQGSADRRGGTYGRSAPISATAPSTSGWAGSAEDAVVRNPFGAAAMTVPCRSARWSPSRWRSKPASASGSRAATRPSSTPRSTPTRSSNPLRLL